MFKARPRLISNYVPLVGHVRDNVVLHNDGSVTAFLAVAGMAWETADVIDIVRHHEDYNTTLQNVAADTLTISTYQCRGMADPAIYPERKFLSTFAANLSSRYRAVLFSRSLFSNQLYIGVTLAPARYAGDMVAEQIAKRTKPAEAAPDDRVQRLHDVCALIELRCPPMAFAGWALPPVATPCSPKSPRPSCSP